MNDLVVTDVHKKLGGNPILKGVSFTLKKGDVVALLGASGSGKTTLLRAIAGLDHPDSGTISLADRTLFDGASGTVVPAEQRGLGLVFQSYALWPHKTVFDNVAYGLRLRRMARSEIDKSCWRRITRIWLPSARSSGRSGASGADEPVPISVSVGSWMVLTVLMILLLWIYYTAMILLLGAETAALYQDTRKAAVEPAPGAGSQPGAARSRRRARA